jgi:hypothetical protein
LADYRTLLLGEESLSMPRAKRSNPVLSASTSVGC